MNYDGAPSFGLKQLYNVLPYSEPQLRRHLRRLEQENWLLVNQDAVDARNRRVAPTEKLLNTYAHYFKLLASAAPLMETEWVLLIAFRSTQEPSGERTRRFAFSAY